MILVVENDPERIAWFDRYIPSLLGQEDSWAVARTPRAALMWLRSKGPVIDRIFLDYDLDDGKGSAVTWYLIKSDLRPKVVVHSMNPFGNWWLGYMLKKSGFDVIRCPYVRLKEQPLTMK